ncbi:hypothetical protein CEUSTIGMA_g6330.t1 [Chlamydomonas eustigma]|uniref:ARID domain-containing protein n=1 Tax=Chlamydomonas eustigma TaxID=1157962 RepID=A0A250X731_9CHLO|nr:hypothetical protein CEUSTIGMA_g6330.t1 [Chlamydomonas eustigma]|eukprot:GAX78891.1 hypothetical protein CEUSTIGMA_g6330.t1 [Chlamydomonas eustigma]
MTESTKDLADERCQAAEENVAHSEGPLTGGDHEETQATQYWPLSEAPVNNNQQASHSRSGALSWGAASSQACDLTQACRANNIWGGPVVSSYATMTTMSQEEEHSNLMKTAARKMDAYRCLQSNFRIDTLQRHQAINQGATATTIVIQSQEEGMQKSTNVEDPHLDQNPKARFGNVPISAQNMEGSKSAQDTTTGLRSTQIQRTEAPTGLALTQAHTEGSAGPDIPGTSHRTQVNTSVTILPQSSGTDIQHTQQHHLDEALAGKGYQQLLFTFGPGHKDAARTRSNLVPGQDMQQLGHASTSASINTADSDNQQSYLSDSFRKTPSTSAAPESVGVVVMEASQKQQQQQLVSLASSSTPQQQGSLVVPEMYSSYKKLQVPKGGEATVPSSMSAANGAALLTSKTEETQPPNRIVLTSGPSAEGGTSIRTPHSSHHKVSIMTSMLPSCAAVSSTQQRPPTSSTLHISASPHSPHTLRPEDRDTFTAGAAVRNKAPLPRGVMSQGLDTSVRGNPVIRSMAAIEWEKEEEAKCSTVTEGTAAAQEGGMAPNLLTLYHGSHFTAGVSDDVGVPAAVEPSHSYLQHSSAGNLTYAAAAAAPSSSPRLGSPLKGSAVEEAHSGVKVSKGGEKEGPEHDVPPTANTGSPLSLATESMNRFGSATEVAAALGAPAYAASHDSTMAAGTPLLPSREGFREAYEAFCVMKDYQRKEEHVVHSTTINTFALWKAIQDRGGFQQVSVNREWGVAARSILNHSIQKGGWESLASDIKRVYKEALHLLEFEKHVWAHQQGEEAAERAAMTSTSSMRAFAAKKKQKQKHGHISSLKASPHITVSTSALSDSGVSATSEKKKDLQAQAKMADDGHANAGQQPGQAGAVDILTSADDITTKEVHPVPSAGRLVPLDAEDMFDEALQQQRSADGAKVSNGAVTAAGLAAERSVKKGSSMAGHSTRPHAAADVTKVNTRRLPSHDLESSSSKAVKNGCGISVGACQVAGSSPHAKQSSYEGIVSSIHTSVDRSKVGRHSLPPSSKELIKNIGNPDSRHSHVKVAGTQQQKLALGNDNHSRVDLWPNLQGPRLVGRRIRVYWPLDEAHYSGTVTSFRAEAHGKMLYTVQYDDGDRELLDLSKEEWTIVSGEEEKEPSTDDYQAPPHYQAADADAEEPTSFLIIARQDTAKEAEGISQLAKEANEEPATTGRAPFDMALIADKDSQQGAHHITSSTEAAAAANHTRQQAMAPVSSSSDRLLSTTQRVDLPRLLTAVAMAAAAASQHTPAVNATHPVGTQLPGAADRRLLQAAAIAATESGMLQTVSPAAPPPDPAVQTGTSSAAAAAVTLLAEWAASLPAATRLGLATSSRVLAARTRPKAAGSSPSPQTSMASHAAVGTAADQPATATAAAAAAAVAMSGLLLPDQGGGGGTQSSKGLPCIAEEVQDSSTLLSCTAAVVALLQGGKQALQLPATATAAPGSSTSRSHDLLLSSFSSAKSLKPLAPAVHEHSSAPETAAVPGQERPQTDLPSSCQGMIIDDLKGLKSDEHSREPHGLGSTEDASRSTPQWSRGGGASLLLAPAPLPEEVIKLISSWKADQQQQKNEVHEVSRDKGTTTGEAVVALDSTPDARRGRVGFGKASSKTYSEHSMGPDSTPSSSQHLESPGSPPATQAMFLTCHGVPGILLPVPLDLVACACPQCKQSLTTAAAAAGPVQWRVWTLQGYSVHAAAAVAAPALALASTSCSSAPDQSPDAVSNQTPQQQQQLRNMDWRSQVLLLPAGQPLGQVLGKRKLSPGSELIRCYLMDHEKVATLITQSSATPSTLKSRGRAEEQVVNQDHYQQQGTETAEAGSAKTQLLSIMSTPTCEGAELPFAPAPPGAAASGIRDGDLEAASSRDSKLEYQQQCSAEAAATDSGSGKVVLNSSGSRRNLDGGALWKMPLAATISAATAAAESGPGSQPNVQHQNTSHAEAALPGPVQSSLTEPVKTIDPDTASGGMLKAEFHIPGVAAQSPNNTAAASHGSTVPRAEQAAAPAVKKKRLREVAALWESHQQLLGHKRSSGLAAAAAIAQVVQQEQQQQQKQAPTLMPLSAAQKKAGAEKKVLTGASNSLHVAQAAAPGSSHAVGIASNPTSNPKHLQPNSTKPNIKASVLGKKQSRAIGKGKSETDSLLQSAEPNTTEGAPGGSMGAIATAPVATAVLAVDHAADARKVPKGDMAAPAAVKKLKVVTTSTAGVATQVDPAVHAAGKGQTVGNSLGHPAEAAVAATGAHAALGMLGRQQQQVPLLKKKPKMGPTGTKQDAQRKQLSLTGGAAGRTSAAAAAAASSHETDNHGAGDADTEYSVLKVQAPSGFEVLTMVGGYSAEEVRIHCWDQGRIVIWAEPREPRSHELWRIKPIHREVKLPGPVIAATAQALMTLHGQLYIRVNDKLD